MIDIEEDQYEEVVSQSHVVTEQEGEDCGSCFCPPTFTAGKCAPGLDCLGFEFIADIPGKCIQEGHISYH